MRDTATHTHTHDAWVAPWGVAQATAHSRLLRPFRPARVTEGPTPVKRSGTKDTRTCSTSDNIVPWSLVAK